MPIPIILGLQNAFGYPTCLKDGCKKCKSECISKRLKWRSGGKECYYKCQNELIKSGDFSIKDFQDELLKENSNQTPKNNPIIIIGSIIIMILLIVFLFLVFKNKNK